MGSPYIGLEAMQKKLKSVKPAPKLKCKNDPLAASPAPEPKKKTVTNSTVTRKKKPKKTGARAKRNAPGDKACREYVKARSTDQTCWLCEQAGPPGSQPRGGQLEWAHMHGRNTGKGVPTRQHAGYTGMVCAGHHEIIDNKTKLSASKRVEKLSATRFKQIVIINGTSFSRVVTGVDFGEKK